MKVSISLFEAQLGDMVKKWAKEYDDQHKLDPENWPVLREVGDWLDDFQCWMESRQSE